MKNKIIAVSLAVAVFFTLVGFANATVLTFDDLTTQPVIGVPVPNGYGDLNWDRIYFSHGEVHGGHVSHGVYSGDYVAYTGGPQVGVVTISAGTFDFISAYLTAMWGSCKITVNGYLGSTLIYSTEVNLPYNPPTKFTFNYLGIDKLEFISLCPTPPCNNMDVLIDDFTFNIADVENGLVAHYQFEGNAYDVSGNGNDGTVFGATFTADRFGGALSFDGVNDYVSVPDNDSLDLTDDLTLGLWLKRVGGYNLPGYLINKTFLTSPSHGNFNLYTQIGYDDVVGFDIPYGDDQIVRSTTFFDQPEWHHVVLTKSGNEYSLYVDGLLEDFNTSNTIMVATDTPLVIGCWVRDIGNTAHFNGVIDEVRIYNRALSEVEVNELYSEGEPPTPCDLTDSDEDGVIDAWDFCPDTPGGSYVDSDGCTTILFTQEDLDLAVVTATAALQSQLTTANASIAALEADKAVLEEEILSLTQSLQSIFSDPNFLFPGDTPEEQIGNLVDAIEDLNYGQQQALYDKLGGTKGNGKKK